MVCVGNDTVVFDGTAHALDDWEKRRHDRNDWSNPLRDPDDSYDRMHFPDRTCAQKAF